VNPRIGSLADDDRLLQWPTGEQSQNIDDVGETDDDVAIGPDDGLAKPPNSLSIVAYRFPH
jgi:hypothetical protein